MTQEQLEELLKDCPRLYHMAEKDSWASIREHGLLSTTALLDHYNVKGDERVAIEASHRPSSISISKSGLPGAVVRDQIPMSDNGLKRALRDELTPQDWYKILNARVFFWMTEDRLGRLLNAKSYREKEQDVLVLDSRSLVAAHREKITLCPINSGNTKPYPWPRGTDTFQRIDAYPYSHWRKKRKAGERVVELCVDHGVADIVDHTLEVRRMLGSEIQSILFSGEDDAA